jgi:hypothetical protein
MLWFFKFCSPKILAKNWRFLLKIMQKFDHNIGFWENANFFRRIFPKFAENCDHNIDPWSSRRGEPVPIQPFPFSHENENKKFWRRNLSADIEKMHWRRTGLPDGIFSNQKFPIWINFGVSCNKRGCEIYGHLVYFTAILYILWFILLTFLTFT